MIVPTVSKKSLSMIENVTSTAVTTPRRAIAPKSRRPNVEKSGACTSARGSVAAPGVGKPCQPPTAPLSTMARAVEPRMPISSAPRHQPRRQHEAEHEDDGGQRVEPAEADGQRALVRLHHEPGREEADEGDEEADADADRALDPERNGVEHGLAKA